MSQKSIIRSYSAGNFFAEVEDYNPQYGTVKLKNSRRLHYWKVKDKKGISLSEVALYGVGDGSRVCSPLPEHYVAEIIEIIPCMPEAAANIESREVYTP